VFSVVLTQAARAELLDAQDWYEGEVLGLGRRFRAEIDTAIERMSANPQQFPYVFKNVRRALLHGFPYMLFFTIEGDTLLLVACFHASRDPRQWQQRT
jgi:plasmid stabilization system protein ParE